MKYESFTRDKYYSQILNLNKRAHRALGRSPEEKIKRSQWSHLQRTTGPPNIGRGPLDDGIHQI